MDKFSELHNNGGDEDEKTKNKGSKISDETRRKNTNIQQEVNKEMLEREIDQEKKRKV